MPSPKSRPPPRSHHYLLYIAVPALAATSFVHTSGLDLDSHDLDNKVAVPSAVAAGILGVGAGVQAVWWAVRWVRSSKAVRRRVRALQDVIERTTTLACFYCNHDVTLAKEVLAISNGRSWQCTLCENWNGVDELDKQRASPSNVYYAKRQGEALASYKSSFFCSTCVQNQNLVQRLLAAYDPGDEEYYEETVDEHKSQLEERYPPLCPDCAVKVQAALVSETNKIKRQLLYQQLVRSSAGDWRNEEDAALAAPRFSQRKANWWRVAANLCLVAIITAMLAVHIRGLMYPISFNFSQCWSDTLDMPLGAPAWSWKSLWRMQCLARFPMTSAGNSQCVCSVLPTMPWYNAWSAPAVLLHPLLLPILGIDGDVWTYQVFQSKLFALRALALYVLTDAWDPSFIAMFHGFCLVVTTFWSLQWIRKLTWTTETNSSSHSNNGSATQTSHEHEFLSTQYTSGSNTLGIEQAFMRSTMLTDRSDTQLAEFRAKRAFQAKIVAFFRKVALPVLAALSCGTRTSSSGPIPMIFSVALSLAWGLVFAWRQDVCARKIVRAKVRIRVNVVYILITLRLTLNVGAWVWSRMILGYTEGATMWHLIYPNTPSPLQCELGDLIPTWIPSCSVGCAKCVLDVLGAAVLFVVSRRGVL